MAGDGLIAQGAYRHGTFISLIAGQLVHALERELEVVTIAAVEHRERAAARLLRQCAIRSRCRNKHGAERINNALRLLLGRPACSH